MTGWTPGGACYVPERLRQGARSWLDDYGVIVEREDYAHWLGRSALDLQSAFDVRLRAPYDHGANGARLGDVGPALSANDAEVRTFAVDAASGAFDHAADSGARDDAGMLSALSAYVRERGIEPPTSDDDAGPALARMLCSTWWVRQLRKGIGRQIETDAIGAKRVHRRAGGYVSDANVKRRAEQKKRNAATLAKAVMVNQFGDEFTLAELAEKSNANPRIRRGELMVRISGFESVARSLGHAAEFITVTAPSRYHAVLSGSCERNPRYDGSSPRDAQKHLCKAWARCRAALARRGLSIYGFRIAEPHHDGCPHWHMLFFMPRYDAQDRSVVNQFRAMVRKYFWKQHDAAEHGAKKNRCKFVAIDWKRGSAAGYVAKYVAKNIDGYAVQGGLSLGDDGQTYKVAPDAVMSAARVDAWAATWGIRQFQQIGGAPVGVWRELRRLENGDGMSDAAEVCRAAADTSGAEATQGWCDYTMGQGGPTVKRDDLTVTLAKTIKGEKWDAEQAAPIPAETRYGEPCARSVYGVRFAHRRDFRAVVTRRFKWRKGGCDVRMGVVGLDGRNPAVGATIPGGAGSGVGGCGREARREEAPKGAQGSAVGRDPWSSVNNCTGVKDEAVRGSERATVRVGGSGHQAGSGGRFAETGRCGDGGFRVAGAGGQSGGNGRGVGARSSGGS